VLLTGNTVVALVGDTAVTTGDTEACVDGAADVPVADGVAPTPEALGAVGVGTLPPELSAGAAIGVPGGVGTALGPPALAVLRSFGVVSPEAHACRAPSNETVNRRRGFKASSVRMGRFTALELREEGVAVANSRLQSLPSTGT
jgi:hypothetical protein